MDKIAINNANIDNLIPETLPLLKDVRSKSICI